MNSPVRASYLVSPLRYPGGKAKLAAYFKALIRKNNLLDGTYVEPFAGGGGVGLSLLFHGYVNRVVLNDLSAPVHAFWRAILDFPERFQEKILSVDLSVAEWERQRRIFQEARGDISFDVGFATFFLNRTNHSGVLNAGMIGGYAQNTKYGLDARFNRQELAARVRRIGRYATSITALNLDAVDLLSSIVDIGQGDRCLLYIDPPYFVKGRDLYYDFYKNEDHVRLRDSISELSSAIDWVVSYDNAPEIVDLYSEYRSHQYDLNYSVKNGRVGREVMFFSDRIVIPPLLEGGLQEILQAA